MDENTRAIVASNLTVAFFHRKRLTQNAADMIANEGDQHGTKAVKRVYDDFLNLLPKS